MAIDDARAKKLLRDFNFPALFVEELGWDKHKTTLSIPIDAETFELSAVAEKRGMAAFVCECDGALPNYNVRRKIERQVAKSAHEHFIIFIDTEKTRQIWQWVKREPGKPAAAREHRFDRSQSGEALIQKLKSVAFELAEEESLTLVDVTIRARTGFDVEKVTKRFYDRFQKEHAAFLKFIKGIPDDQLQRWYASVMLNRLMFIYFIQKKGFLDGDADYLRSKLEASKPKDRYYSHFLCPLFFEGFAKKADDRSAATNQLLGRVPYLNGGLFLRHQIEELHGKTIQIPDAAFEHIFDFFEAYQWHLDERPLRADNEINPDVLGYIFEKYINQKQMGAYYTKEDITEYISKNTVLPFLFDAARPKCKIAFKNPSGPTIWNLLKADPDRYIYDAVRKGVEIPLPKEIEAGIKDVSKRQLWNKPPPWEFALPTEIWREVIARQQRYQELRKKLTAGEVSDINELITLNIDIRQFAQDVIENCEGPELLRAFWHAIENVTVLDPACGSGAFLFAALNILEPLYEACLDRMAAFVEELDRSRQKHRPEKFSDFREVLKRMAAHASRKYFVFKTIILNNLFGVDIMEEATEICKLRLFLKLVAQIDRVDQIEPLPDIDFNIRAGNTLVGYATADEVRRCMQEFGSGQMRLGVEDELKSYGRFTEKVEIADRAFRRFREMQTEQGLDAKDFANAKQTLRQRLKALEDELNQYLTAEYGVKPERKADYSHWLKSHEPFHWFVEFYGIISNGGFDAIIGNPPYLEYSKVKDYTVQNYSTDRCANLYAYMVERSFALSNPHGRTGMIIPISVACSGAMGSLRDCLNKTLRTFWLSHFSNRPGQLFTGAQNRLTIFLSSPRASAPRQFSTRYHRWDARNGERENLFALLRYHELECGASIFHGLLPKIGCAEGAALKKIQSKKSVEFFLSNRGQHSVCWVRVPGYFCQFLIEPPMARPENGGRARPRGEVNEIAFDDQRTRNIVHAVLNSSTYYQFFCTYTDTRHINPSDVVEFPLDVSSFNETAKSTLNELSIKLNRCARRHTSHWRKSGLLIESVDSKPCKPIIDEIDCVLAQHYGFTAEETDFIINYDIKYRMGLGGEHAEE